MQDDGTAVTMSVGPFGVGASVAGRYEIRGLLGAGGMGAVYRAWDRELDEDIALKVLQVGGPTAADALVRFRREVKLARRVTHPNVARTYDLGEFEGLRFLTMELITGQSLRERLESPLALPEALRITSEIARGLSVAHAAGVVHCDLKPENVMLADTRVVITDFGIARGAEVSDLLRTAGSINGTPAYMAPEQVEGRELDGRADVFALGIMLFELLSGKLPFTGDSAVVLATARVLRDAPDVRTVQPLVPANLASLLASGLARRREARLDAHGFLQAIERLRAGAEEGNAPVPVPFTTTGAVGGWLPSANGHSVYIAPMAAQEGTEELATPLAEALSSAIAGDRRMTLTATSTDADLVLSGSVRAVKDHVRVRVALAAAAPVHGVRPPLWSAQVDGLVSDPFRLEDEVVREVSKGLGKVAAASSGPEDETLQGVYEKALEAYESLDPQEVRRASAFLDALPPEGRQDPWFMTLEARIVTRLWLLEGAILGDAPLRAEELLLRALAKNPRIPEAHHTLGVLRLTHGDFSQARRAFEEALRRSPTLAASHVELGLIACEIGHAEEGIRHLDLALRLQPKSVTGNIERLRIAACFEPRAAVEARLQRLEQLIGPAAALVFPLRLSVWWQDRELALATATRLEGMPDLGQTWTLALPFLRAYGEGRVLDVADGYVEVVENMPVTARRKCLIHEFATEHLAAAGNGEAALRHIAVLAQRPFVNVLWLDHCPCLAGVRGDARFAHARAIVAARAAAVWG